VNPDAVLTDLDTKARFVNVTEVLDFVSRTVGHGVPERIAISRAAKRYSLDAGLIRSFVRSAA